MSAFLVLTLKSSQKSAFLRKRVHDPRAHAWTDHRISKDMRVLSKIWHWHKTCHCSGKVCP